MRSSESIAELAQALAKAQGAMKAAKKTEDNPFFKSKYTDLAGVWDAIRDALSTNNLAVVQTTDHDEAMGNAIMVSTVLMHSSGQWIEGVTKMPLVKIDPQAVGSAITYARRYALAAIVGVASEVDDDGEAAMGRKDDQQNRTNPPRTQPQPVTQASNAPQAPQNTIAPLIKAIYEQVTSEAGLGMKEEEFLPYISTQLGHKVESSMSKECTPEELRNLHKTLKKQIESRQQ